ncbi:unnamed protein product [marine sediment metagenome]|uniref:Uncharacterized protein n=1 Tax=marine sediment metagenome TaxID=412755 RepID=X0VYZ7_9ZZZZ
MNVKFLGVYILKSNDEIHLAAYQYPDGRILLADLARWFIIDRLHIITGYILLPDSGVLEPTCYEATQERYKRRPEALGRHIEDKSELVKLENIEIRRFNLFDE